MELMTDELHVAKRKLLDMTKRWQKTKEDLGKQQRLLTYELDDNLDNVEAGGGESSRVGRRPRTAVVRWPTKNRGDSDGRSLVRSSSWMTSTPKKKFVGGGFNVSNISFS